MVACSDRNFRAGLSEFKARLEPGGVDRIVEPGGPHIFLKDPTAWDRAKFLITQHGVKHILLVGHAGCGAYADMYKDSGHSEEQLNSIIKEDLKTIGESFKQQIPGTKLWLYFARPEGDRVLFEPIIKD